MRARRRQQPDETRTLILDTADRLLRERPFRELSVDDVMRPTGYGRTVFYRHFGGLADLVTAVLARVLPPFVLASQQLAQGASGEVTLERARELLGPVVAHWHAHGPLMKALRDASVYDRDIDVRVVEAQERLRAVTTEAVRQRQEAGFLAGVDAEQVAMALASMTQRYLLMTFGETTATASEAAAVETLALVWVATLTAP